MRHRSFPFLFFAFITSALSAQTDLHFDPSIPVIRNGAALTLAWAGGLNDVQPSSIDLNGDDLLDIFIFDRSGNKPVFLLNVGTQGQAQYRVTHAYDTIQPFPLLHDWALLRDYNCDGKADIFASVGLGFAVYRNTSDASGLSFTLTDDLVGSAYPTPSPNLFVTGTDIPSIEDIDGDGDLDVLTFSILGSTFLEYHKNKSMELYGNCDSLIYEVRSNCWGEFVESSANSSITLDTACNYNVPNPELPFIGPHGELMAPSDRHHSGSTLLALDLNGDNIKDLLIGDFTYPKLHGLINGGTLTHSHMTSVDSTFPQNDVEVNIQNFVAPFFLDIDGDGKRDLVACPNSTNQSENAESVWYYRNTGTDSSPIFIFQQPDLFQDQMLEFGDGARPILFDFNGDGLMDLVVANEGYFEYGADYRGQLALLENTGTLNAPAFILVTANYLGLDTMGFGPGFHPSFGDVDGDGKQDLIVGDNLGFLHYFHNTSTGPVAQFLLSPALISDDLGALIDVGLSATPQLFDVDGDGLLDLLIGERNGNLNYYRNSGTATAAQWHFETADMGGVNVQGEGQVTGYTVPYMYIGEGGQRELLSGSEEGPIWHYDGIAGNILGQWNLEDSVWKGFHEGARTALVYYDFTGDGHLDAVVGNYRGGLSFWSSEADVGVAEGSAYVSDGFLLAPNPAQGSVDIIPNRVMPADAQIQLLDELGRIALRLPMGQSRRQMDLSGVAPGCYLVRLAGTGVNEVQRLVVLR
ncbi:MAG: FG-GAP-like repeat-containing protein [Flavobacteriales bacterium]